MSGPLPSCRRTAGIVDRLLDDGLGEDDRQHVDVCPTCAAALAEARRFEIALGRSAGGLVEEPLPRSALDAPALVPRGWRWRAPAWVIAATSVIVLAVATATSLAGLARNAGEPLGSLSPLDASLAVPGMTISAVEDALLDLGMACVANDKGAAGVRCTGHDPGTGASLYATVSRAGNDGVADLKATMSVPVDEAAMDSKGPQMGSEQVSRRVSDEAFLAFVEPLAELPFTDPGEISELRTFVERTIGGANGSCQCMRRIGEVHLVLEGSVGWSWDLRIARP